MLKVPKSDFAVLYYNPKHRVFLVVSVAQDGLARVELRPPKEISDSVFNSEIKDILLAALDSFQKNAYSVGQARGGTRDENRRFVREHLSVHIERLPSGDLIIKPLHHEKGGYVGKAEEHILLEQRAIASHLGMALRKAFEIAS